MKIFRDNSVYVQKNDIAHLNMTERLVPASIYMKVFGSGITIINDSNRYEFISYDGASEVDYFKSLDWIIDYDDVKEMSEDDIIEMAHDIAAEQSGIASVYNTMSDEERRYHPEMVDQCNLLEYKFYSLRDFLWFRQGHIQMELPEGVSYPSQMVRENGIKRFFKRMKEKYKK